MNSIDPTAQISKYARLDVSTKGTQLFVGAYSVIDDFVKIKQVGGAGDVIIGEYVYVNSGTIMYSGNGIKIGNSVLIGPNCSIVPVNHEYKNPNQLIRLQGFKRSKGGITIHDDVWLGANVTIVDGVTIGKGAIISANSLLKDNVEEYAIYAGNPAKKIGSRLDE